MIGTLAQDINAALCEDHAAMNGFAFLQMTQGDPKRAIYGPPIVRNNLGNLCFDCFVLAEKI